MNKITIPVEEIRILLEHLKAGFDVSKNVSDAATTPPILIGDDFRSHFAKEFFLTIGYLAKF